MLPGPLLARQFLTKDTPGIGLALRRVWKLLILSTVINVVPHPAGFRQSTLLHTVILRVTN